MSGNLSSAWETVCCLDWLTVEALPLSVADEPVIEGSCMGGKAAVALCGAGCCVVCGVAFAPIDFWFG